MDNIYGFPDSEIIGEHDRDNILMASVHISMGIGAKQSFFSVRGAVPTERVRDVARLPASDTDTEIDLARRSRSREDARLRQDGGVGQ